MLLCVVLFSWTNESPGEYFYRDGIRMKKYRGMGSKKQLIIDGKAVRYFDKLNSNVPVTHELWDSYMVSIHRFIPYMVQELNMDFRAWE